MYDFSSASYFTPLSEKEMIEYDRLWAPYLQALQNKNEAEMKNALSFLVKFIDKKRKAIDTSYLELQDFPRFMYQPDVLISIQKAFPKLVLLVFTSVLFFTLSLMVFVRCDVR